MKSSGYERVVMWIVLAALGLFTIVCIFWTPYDQSKLLRPIPANAVLITSHRNLGPRLEHMATNIFLKAIFDSNETAVKNLRNNRYAVRILASRSIVAYVPDFNQSSNPALAISSWVGGWTPVFRWALWIHPPKDIAPLGEYNGYRLWAYKKPIPFFGAVNYFSFAFDEGIFIGCLSQDRSGVVYLLRNYDGRKDSILSIPACNAMRSIAGRPEFRLMESPSAADQVWMRVDLPNATQNKSIFAVCSLDALENDYLAATVRFEPDLGFRRRSESYGGQVADSPSRLAAAKRSGEAGSAMAEREASICANDGLRQNQDLAEIGKMSVCSPSSIALFPSDMVADGLNEFTRLGGLISPAWARTIKPILAPSSGTNNVCMLMVFTGAYGGKLGKEPFRITVPTVLLAVSGSRQEQAKAAVLELLDLINQKHRLGLILNSALPPAGQCPVFAIESTSDGLLKSLPVEDHPAFSFYNDWFLLASNSAGLRKLLLNFQSQTGAADDGKNNWLNQMDNRQKKAFIWIDPDAGGKALRLAFMASIIMLNTDDKNASNRNAIKFLKAARSWLEGISNLKNCAAWMESENGKTVLRLEIGCKRTGTNSSRHFH